MKKAKGHRSKGSMSPEDQINEEAELLKSQLARTLADYDNLRKRVEEERKVWGKVADSKAALKLLPVLDMLNDSQNHLQDPGIAIIIKVFEDSLNDLGIEKIAVKVGDKFDPEIEEVIETLSGGEDGAIGEINLTGWKLKDEDFIVRPAKVKVYKSDKIETKDGLEKETN